MENMKSTAGARRDAEEADAVCNKNVSLEILGRENIFVLLHFYYISLLCTHPLYHSSTATATLKYTLRAKPNERENTALQTYTCTGE